MADKTHIHDKFFKELLGRPEIAADFLRYYLPAEVAAVLDVSAPEPVREAFVDDELQEHFADLLYRVRLREGREAFVFMLFEHKSAPDRWVAFQALRYQVHLWERLRAEGVNELPPVYTVIFYHGESPWRSPLNFRALVAIDADSPLLKHIPEFECYLLDTAELEAVELRGAPHLQIGLLLFRDLSKRDGRAWLPAVFDLFESGDAYLKTVITYISTVRDDLPGAEIRATLADARSRKGDQMPNAIDEWIQEGRQEGILLGMLTQTLRLLRRRFGTLDEMTTAQLGRLTTEQLGELGEALFDLSTKPELEAWLRQLPTRH